MNEHVMEILVRTIVASLPEKEKDVYQYIVRTEDELARQSHTKEEFMGLLTRYSPHHQAAAHFNMSIEDTLKLMHMIEDKITERMEEKSQSYKWIDYSDLENTPSKLQFLCWI
ncbi:hypothetical protein ACQCVE_07940 [Metabacillus sp. 113a]|uniref:hypothetical protein n=1 Tax=Metabacillus sp. 113a TaxID=3404706 RepID=UPI003CEB0347